MTNNTTIALIIANSDFFSTVLFVVADLKETGR